MASALGSIPPGPPPGVVETPLGLDYSPAQIQQIQNLGRVPLGAAESVLGKNFQELLQDFDNGGDTTVINYGGGGGDDSGGRFGDGPHGWKRIFANLTTMLAWYTITFLACDFIYSDFNIFKTLERLPRFIFGPMDYLWQDVLGRPPRGEGALSGVIGWAENQACQLAGGSLPESLCDCTITEPDSSAIFWCETACAAGWAELGWGDMDSCTDSCTAGSTTCVLATDQLSKSITVSQADEF